MEENIDVNARLKELDGIHNYLKIINTNVTMILQSVNWDRNHLQNSNVFNTCEVDFNHRVPRDKLLQHESLCKLSREGYLKDAILLPTCSVEGRSTIKLTTDTINEIIQVASKHDPKFKKGINGDSIPNSVDRLFSAHTTDERRALYDYVVSKTLVKKESMDGFIMNQESEHSHSHSPKSSKELLALERDMKRRRVKYKVSTKSKNYTHILKEVIENQMMMFKDRLDSSPSSSNKANENPHIHDKSTHESREKNIHHSNHDQKSAKGHGKTKHLEIYKDKRSTLKDLSRSGSYEYRRERSHSKIGSHEYKREKNHSRPGDHEYKRESYHRKSGSQEYKKESSHTKIANHTRYKIETSHIKTGSYEYMTEGSHSGHKHKLNHKRQDDNNKRKCYEFYYKSKSK